MSGCRALSFTSNAPRSAAASSSWSFAESVPCIVRGRLEETDAETCELKYSTCERSRQWIHGRTKRSLFHTKKGLEMNVEMEEL